MSSLRGRFEQTETAKLWLSYRIEFDSYSNYYWTESEYKSDVDSLNAAWKMFQELNNENN